VTGSPRRSVAMLAALLLPLVAGCATPYEPKDGGEFGYSETRLAPDMVEVFFDVNADTPAEHASDFVLLRCAEFTLIQGYSHLVLLERVTAVESALVGSPVPQPVYAATYGSCYSAYSVNAAVSIRTLDSPHGYARIRMTTSAEDGALDAAFLIQSVKSKYAMP